MLNIETLAPVLAGLAVPASCMPAHADSGNAIEIRSLNASTADDMDLKYGLPNCVELHCIHNADGLLNPWKRHEAFVRAHQR